jgi:hypothetical protein
MTKIFYYHFVKIKGYYSVKIFLIFLDNLNLLVFFKKNEFYIFLIVLKRKKYIILIKIYFKLFDSKKK